jgi:hypothetical protein
MPDITRDPARLLRAPDDATATAPGAPPPGVEDDFDIGAPTAEIAQAPPAPALSPPQSCPPGTAPNSTSIAIGANVSVQGVQAGVGFSLGTANCAPTGPMSPGSGASGASGSTPPGSGGGSSVPDSPLTGYP